MKPLCYILVGPPAAGKSTWANKLLESDSTFVYTSSDAYIEIEAGCRGMTYNEVFKDHIKPATKFVMDDCKQAVSEGRNIIIDRTNMSKKARKIFIDMFIETHSISAITFDAPDEVEHQRRLTSRPGKNIPDNIVKSMMENYESPTMEEGFACIWRGDS